MRLRRDYRVLEASWQDSLARERRLRKAAEEKVLELTALRETEARLFPEQMPFPYPEGDTIVLGPEIFASLDGSVIAWKGRNYVPSSTQTTWRDAITLSFNIADANSRSPYLGSVVREAERDRAEYLLELLEGQPMTNPEDLGLLSDAHTIPALRREIAALERETEEQSRRLGKAGRDKLVLSEHYRERMAELDDAYQRVEGLLYDDRQRVAELWQRVDKEEAWKNEARAETQAARDRIVELEQELHETRKALRAALDHPILTSRPVGWLRRLWHDVRTIFDPEAR